MKKEKVLIFGASEHAKVIIDIFEKERKLQILGLVDDNPNLGATFFDYPVLGTTEHLPQIFEENPSCKVFVAIGDNWVRHKVVEKIKQIIPTADFASTIHPSAQIGKNVIIGKGVAVMAGAVINPDSILEDFVIINTRASLDHDGLVKSFSSLAPSVVTGGQVKIGSFTAIGIGATILHGIKIGQHTVIGAGALVLKDCGDQEVLYGSPAKVIRKRAIGDRYL